MATDRGDDSAQALFALSNEVEAELFEMQRLNDLAMWVEEARDFIQSVRLSVGTDPSFGGMLRIHRLNAIPAWERETSEGMVAMHQHIGRLVRGVSRSVSDAVDETKVGHG